MARKARIDFNVQDVDQKIASMDAKALGVTNKNGDSFQVTSCLQIHLTPLNKKTWRLRYKFQGKARNPTIGIFPAMSFHEAKSVLNETLALIEKGEDPYLLKTKVPSQKQKTQTKLPFNEAFHGYCYFKRGNGNVKYAKWSEITLEQHLKIFKKHVLPTIGNKEVAKITVRDLTKVLRDIEEKGSLAIRDKAFKAFKGMYAWMVGKHIEEGSDLYPSLNLAISIPQEVFIKREPKNFKHVTAESDVKKLVNKVYNLSASFEVRQALKIQLHLFLRPGPLSELRWSDIRFLDEIENPSKHDKYDLLEIPGERMKMDKDFLSTLSPQVKKLFLELREVTGHSNYVFLSPYRSGDNRPISRDSLSNAMKRNGIVDTTTHGFRHMASTLLRDVLKFSQDSSAIEVQLSHIIGGVEGYYNKAQYLDRRFEIMNAWSKYIESLLDKKPVEAIVFNDQSAEKVEDKEPKSIPAAKLFF